MNFISHLTTSPKALTLKQMSKYAVILISLGIIIGIYVQVSVTPRIAFAWGEFVDSFSSDVTYTAPAVVNTTEDRVDAYYEEEYTALQEKYEQKRKDEALLNAIERVEQEFETTKETIRERELFI